MIDNRAPRFRDGTEIIQADTCRPLVEAVEQGDLKMHAVSTTHYPGVSLPEGNLDGLASVGYWDAKKQQSWGLPWHRNEGLELTFLETGSLEFQLRDASYRLRPRDLTIARPWQRHRVGNPHVTPGKLYWAIIDFGVRRPNQTWQWPSWITLVKDDVERLTKLLRHNEQAVVHSNTKMAHIWKQIGELIDLGEHPGWLSTLSIRINEVLCCLFELLDSNEIIFDEQLVSARRTVSLFLDHLVFDESELAHPWTIPEMADQCGIGATSFTKHCKELTNLSPHAFLTQARIQAARKMLEQQTELNISEIAIKCGFSSSQYFSTIFRKETGITPSDFRQD